MTRDSILTNQLPDPVREAVGLPCGDWGEFFVGDDSFRGQTGTIDVIDGNSPPPGQPGLWCQWVPDEEGNIMTWDGGEKFYEYIDWIKYLINHFLKPWGYSLHGRVNWDGEDYEDMGYIEITANNVKVFYGHVTYEEVP